MENEKVTPVTEDEMDDIRVTLSLDNKDVECRILTIYEVDEQNYIALMPLDENDNDTGDIYVYRYSEDENGIPSVENILDDDEYEAAIDRFDEMQDEIMFNEMED